MRHRSVRVIVKGFSLLSLLITNICMAEDVRVVKDRMHKMLKESFATGYTDRALEVVDKLHYHEYKVQFHKFPPKGFEFTFELPKSEGITLFVASSTEISGVSVEEACAPARNLGSGFTVPASGEEIRLRKTENTQRV